MKIDYDLLNKQIHNFNPFKEDPRTTQIKESVKLFLDTFNKQIAASYLEENKRPITNFPTDDMIKYATSNPLATLAMSHTLSMIYEEESGCFVLEDILYDEHQKDINSSNFNALLLWTRIFSKLGMIELKKNDKESKKLEYKVLDKKLVDNLIDFSNNDLESIRNASKNVDLGNYKHYIDKLEKMSLKGKSEAELGKVAEDMFSDILVQMMNDITKVINNGNEKK